MLPFEINQYREIIESGSLGLDICLGRGGYLPGTVVEISGLPETGKTTLGLHAIANAQGSRNYCAWIDTNQDFSPQRAIACGVDLTRLLYSTPNTLEQALETVYLLSRSSSVALIVVDSLDVFIREPEGFSTDTSDAYSTDTLSSALIRISNSVQKSGTIVVFTTLFDTSLSNTYHLLSKQLGRLSLQLHATTRIKLKSSSPEEFDDINKKRILAKVVKNKVISSRKSIEFDIIVNRGVHRQAEIFDFGISEGFIRKEARGYFFKMEYLGASQNEAIISLDNDHQLSDSVEAAIRRKMIPPY